MIKSIKKLFAKPTLEDKVNSDLEYSRLKLIEHEEMTSYHAQMVVFYKQSILRLQGYQNELTK